MYHNGDRAGRKSQSPGGQATLSLPLRFAAKILYELCLEVFLCLTKPAFKSVIVAGVYDIKNLKHKLRNDDEHKYNSPWNITADSIVDMRFSQKDIDDKKIIEAVV